MRNLAQNPNAVVHLEKGNEVVIVEGVGALVTTLDDGLTGRLLDGFAKYITSTTTTADPENWAQGIWAIRPMVAFGLEPFPRRHDAVDLRGATGMSERAAEPEPLLDRPR